MAGARKYFIFKCKNTIPAFFAFLFVFLFVNTNYADENLSLAVNSIKNSIVYESADVYDRIKPYYKEPYSNGAVWVQGIAGQFEYDAVESNSKYTNIYSGISAGYDRLMLKNFLLGLFVKYKSIGNEYANSKKKINAEKYEVGIYGGFVNDNIEVKTFVSVAQNEYVPKLFTGVSTVEQGPNFSDNIVLADAEVALKSEVGDAGIFKIYAGLEAEFEMHNEFKIKTTNNTYTTISSGDYLRQAARLGIGLKRDNNKNFVIYLNVEAKHFLNDAQFYLTDELSGEKFYVYNERNLSAGILTGVAFNIFKSFRIFVNANYIQPIGIDSLFREDDTIEFGNYRTVSGNVGIRYSFGEGSGDARFKKGKEPKDAEKERTAFRVARRQEQKNSIAPIEHSEKPEKTTILFYGEYPLDASYMLGLKSLVKRANETGYSKIVVEAHADSTGTEQQNEKICLSRANLIKGALLELDIPSDKITIVVQGSQMPIASNKTQAGRTQNRRVEIKFY
jgi:outer membrane protein OmpA-like peptidoglycan-associated protein